MADYLDDAFVPDLKVVNLAIEVLSIWVDLDSIKRMSYKQREEKYALLFNSSILSSNEGYWPLYLIVEKKDAENVAMALTQASYDDFLESYREDIEHEELSEDNVAQMFLDFDVSKYEDVNCHNHDYSDYLGFGHEIEDLVREDYNNFYPPHEGVNGNRVGALRILESFKRRLVGDGKTI